MEVHGVSEEVLGWGKEKQIPSCAAAAAIHSLLPPQKKNSTASSSVPSPNPTLYWPSPTTITVLTLAWPGWDVGSCTSPLEQMFAPAVLQFTTAVYLLQHHSNTYSGASEDDSESGSNIRYCVLCAGLTPAKHFGFLFSSKLSHHSPLGTQDMHSSFSGAQVTAQS